MQAYVKVTARDMALTVGQK